MPNEEKNNEGDEMKYTFDIFKIKLMRATKKEAKNIAWKMFFFIS